MKTLTEQYRLIKKDKGHKGLFLKEAKRLYPNLLTNSSTFREASTILKQKNIINENFVGMAPINNPFEVKEKEPYEKAFEKFLKEGEVKAEEKKVSKEVEEDQEHIFDIRDKKNPENMIFGQIQMGYYYEMKEPKNTDKTIDEIKKIVFKNLEKDPIYYTKKGQFGVDVGYTDDAPGLGEPKEAKGKYKSSGYGNLKENRKIKRKLIKEHSITLAGGIVTGGGFHHLTLKQLLGEDDLPDYDYPPGKEGEAGSEEFAPSASPAIENAIGPLEDLYEELGSLDAVIEFVTQHLGGKYGDY